MTGFVATDSTNKLIVVSFRGTNSIRNAITNTLFLLIPVDICPSCRGFKGFWFSWLEARTRVIEAVENAVADYPDYGLVVVGHSLGGAIATFAAAQLRNAGYAAALVCRVSLFILPLAWKDVVPQPFIIRKKTQNICTDNPLIVHIWRTTRWRQRVIVVHHQPARWQLPSHSRWRSHS